MVSAGRLKWADEIITKADQSYGYHAYQNEYDMRSQLTFAEITNIGGSYYVSDRYSYDKAGNVREHIYDNGGSVETIPYSFTGDLMTQIGDADLTWNANGNLTLKDQADDTNLIYNWDNKLRAATKGTEGISVKYDPLGNRVLKANDTVTRKYIIDVSGALPTILLELDPCDGMAIKKTYIYANSEIMAQHDGDSTAARYFYLHDRLGSVREVIDTDGDVVNYYTYKPFGEVLESGGTLTNPFMFTGQYYDSEIAQYYLRARQYDPQLMRFTGRDGVYGKFERPLSLHKYLYCENEPINRIDLTGLEFQSPWGYWYKGTVHDEEQTRKIIEDATAFAGLFNHTPLWWLGPILAHAIPGWYDVKERAHRDIFDIGGNERLLASEFGNYLAGYTSYYNFQGPGLVAALAAGQYFGMEDWWAYRTGDSTTYKRWYQDDFSSMYWIMRGAKQANLDAYNGLGAQVDNIMFGAIVWQLDILRQLDYFDYSEDALW